jgi:GAF domain-containing protein
MLDSAELVKEIQDMREAGHLSDALLRRAVKAIGRSDDRYDWVGVYLLDEDKGELWLHNYVGPPTDHSRIPVGEGVQGRAITEGSNLNIADLSAEESPYTGSMTEAQIVVLIRAGDDVFGELGVESSRSGALGEEDELRLQTVADKLAEQLVAERR